MISTDAIGATNNTAGAATTPAPISNQPGNTTVDYDAFLKLLVTQMRNQDPTKPTDSAEYLSQLASFSSVEQQITANRKLDTLISAVTFSQSAGLIGKTVESSTSGTGGVVVSVDKAGDAVRVRLEDGAVMNLSDLSSIR